MKGTLPARSVVVDGHRTSMRLEPEFWSVLEEISLWEELTVSEICTQISRRRARDNLSSAVRIFTVVYGRSHALAQALEAIGESSEPFAPLVPAALSNVRARAKRLTEDACNREEALAYSLEDLSGFPHPVFAHAVTVWNANRRTSPPGLPDPGAVWTALEQARARTPRHPAEETTTFNIINVAAENPQRFLLGRLQAISQLFAGANISHAPVAAHPFALHARGMQLDFSQTKMDPVPRLHVLRHAFNGTRRHYARLTLPLSSDQKSVDTILTVAARLSPPRLPEAGLP